MDSQTTSPAAPDPLAAMFQNATVNTVERSEFNSSARDMFKFVVNNNYNISNEESSDIIGLLRNAVLPFLAEIRKNDQSRSAVGKTTGADGSDSVPQPVTALEDNPVNIIDIVPPEPSSLPVASIADRYTRSMLKSLVGYPLYDPKPFSELSKEYLRIGVSIGDVGFVRRDGTFDFLFNICPPQKDLFNPPDLPDGFFLGSLDQLVTRNLEPLPRNTCLFQSPITKTRSGEYVCEGSEGAILELPEGAIQDEATNTRPFAKLAARHGVQWYEYTVNRGRDISNDSLYLITSFTKCSQWGIAVFDRPCAPGQGLKFDKKRSLPFGKSTSKYHFKGSGTFPTKVSNLNKGNAPNQCVFLRGYKIMIRRDVFNSLCNGQPSGSVPEIPSSSPQATRHRATRIRGGAGTEPISQTLASRGLLSRSTMFTKKSDEAVLQDSFDSPLVHPSDVINAALLSQNPDAKVALTHDNVWCNLLRDNFPKVNYASLINVAQSYTSIVDEYDCVSLEKTADSSNSLDQSSPLQGTKTPALQGPLVTPDDESVHATISLTLPRELVERIILLLDTESMLTCKLVNKEFNEIIQSSTLLQYFLACKAAGVIDNPQSPLSCAERLEVLKKREDAWRMLKPVFEMTIQVSHNPSPKYGLTGGACFLGDMNRKDLHYFHLPSTPQDDPKWIRVPGHGPGESGPGILVSFASAAYEHNLMANVISSEIGNQADTQQHSLDLILLEFSTGEYHPLARHPRIHVQSSPEDRPLVISKIAGDNLALIVSNQDGDGRYPDKLFVFDWKTGHKRLQHETTKNAYSSLAFVSPELLLVSNLILFHFEVWHLAPSHPGSKPPVQVLSLQMPAVAPDYSLFSVSFHGEPRPFLHSIPFFPPRRPFSLSPENSIIIANFHFESSLDFRIVSHTLIMHCHALLDTIQKWASPSFLEQQVDLSTWFTNEVNVNNIADPDDGLVRLCAQSKLASEMPHPMSSLPTRGSPTSSKSHISSDFGPLPISSGSSTSAPTSGHDFLQIQWANWGPPISRWFLVHGTQARWTMKSTGQRYAVAVPSPRDNKKLMVSVADFNPHNLRRNAEMMARLREDEDSSGNGNNEERTDKGGEEEEWEKMDHEGVFAEEVYMGLKCAVYHAPDEYDLDAVMMDEESLLGLKLDHEGNVESVKVLHFG